MRHLLVYLLWIANCAGKTKLLSKANRKPTNFIKKIKNGSHYLLHNSSTCCHSKIAFITTKVTCTYHWFFMFMWHSQLPVVSLNKRNSSHVGSETFLRISSIWNKTATFHIWAKQDCCTKQLGGRHIPNCLKESRTSSWKVWYDGLGFDAEDQHHKKSAENTGHISSESGVCILPSLCHSLKCSLGP